MEERESRGYEVLKECLYDSNAGIRNYANRINSKNAPLLRIINTK